jgi:hypothetical protein
MRSSILTDLERKQAKAYVKQDGLRNVNVRVLTVRAQRYLPRIEEDVELLQQVLDTYRRSKANSETRRGPAHA